ncbi:uncharacterized protein LOC134185425 [Corticium candelabrum]|uniref:uncharacterized protein LOC134185425 n=1 Tax=Corticium candelabrum TaxID=121492 RepID=UPI002E259A7A|nr:uncharacterized protein LOC134185425 [Corticium candelabrum]
MAAIDVMPRLIDDDENEDDDIPIEEFNWLQTEAESNTPLERNKTVATFGDLPLTYEEIVFIEPDPLAMLCTVTISDIMQEKSEEDEAAASVVIRNCENAVETNAKSAPCTATHTATDIVTAGDGAV